MESDEGCAALHLLICSSLTAIWSTFLSLSALIVLLLKRVQER